jgi:hypothetical protein
VIGGARAQQTRAVARKTQVVAMHVPPVPEEEKMMRREGGRLSLRGEAWIGDADGEVEEVHIAKVVARGAHRVLWKREKQRGTIAADESLNNPHTGITPRRIDRPSK